MGERSIGVGNNSNKRNPVDKCGCEKCECELPKPNGLNPILKASSNGSPVDACVCEKCECDLLNGLNPILKASSNGSPVDGCVCVKSKCEPPSGHNLNALNEGSQGRLLVSQEQSDTQPISCLIGPPEARASLLELNEDFSQSTHEITVTTSISVTHYNYEVQDDYSPQLPLPYNTILAANATQLTGALEESRKTDQRPLTVAFNQREQQSNVVYGDDFRNPDTRDTAPPIYSNFQTQGPKQQTYELTRARQANYEPHVFGPGWSGVEPPDQESRLAPPGYGKNVGSPQLLSYNGTNMEQRSRRGTLGGELTNNNNLRYNGEPPTAQNPQSVYGNFNNNTPGAAPGQPNLNGTFDNCNLGAATGPPNLAGNVNNYNPGAVTGRPNLNGNFYNNNPGAATGQQNLSRNFNNNNPGSATGQTNLTRNFNNNTPGTTTGQPNLYGYLPFSNDMANSGMPGGSLSNPLQNMHNQKQLNPQFHPMSGLPVLPGGVNFPQTLAQMLNYNSNATLESALGAWNGMTVQQMQDQNMTLYQTPNSREQMAMAAMRSLLQRSSNSLNQLPQQYNNARNPNPGCSCSCCICQAQKSGKNNIQQQCVQNQQQKFCACNSDAGQSEECEYVPVGFSLKKAKLRSKKRGKCCNCCTSNDSQGMLQNNEQVIIREVFEFKPVATVCSNKSLANRPPWTQAFKYAPSKPKFLFLEQDPENKLNKGNCDSDANTQLPRFYMCSSSPACNNKDSMSRSRPRVKATDNIFSCPFPCSCPIPPYKCRCPELNCTPQKKEPTNQAEDYLICRPNQTTCRRQSQCQCQPTQNERCCFSLPKPPTTKLAKYLNSKCNGPTTVVREYVLRPRGSDLGF